MIPIYASAKPGVKFQLGTTKLLENGGKMEVDLGQKVVGDVLEFSVDGGSKIRLGSAAGMTHVSIFADGTSVFAIANYKDATIGPLCCVPCGGGWYACGHGACCDNWCCGPLRS